MQITVRRVLFAAGLAAMLGGCAAHAPTEKPAPSAAEEPSAASARSAGKALAPDTARIMVGAAASMLGQPYRFGGAAPGGFDCSGLVAYAAGKAGVRLPRRAHEQLQAGVPIGRHELKAGDLVFMHLARKELHVGIAIDAERFVHAPSTGGSVRIDSLAAPPYSAAFLSARRVIN
jgi:cell wall-associated NlpC family hydrolase